MYKEFIINGIKYCVESAQPAGIRLNSVQKKVYDIWKHLPEQRAVTPVARMNLSPKLSQIKVVEAAKALLAE